VMRLALLALACLALHPMTDPSTPPERDTHPLLALNSQSSINSSISRFSSSKVRTTRVSPWVFFFFKLVGGGGICRPWDPVLKKSYHHLGLSPMRPNELGTDQKTGCQRSSCGSVRRGRGGDWCSQRRS